MNVFPQLSSGAIAQFPFRGSVRFRTALNELANGSEVSFGDAGFEQRRWRLEFDGLSDSEWQALEDLFQASEGRLKTFTFLAPGENLLAWSEALTDPVWVAVGGTATDGVADPAGGTAASRLTAGAGPLTVSQTLPIPSAYVYAASVWVKTTSAGAQMTVGDGASGARTAAFLADGQWRRYELTVEGLPPGAQTVYELSVPAGGTADVYGAQLEAQRSASAYKPTGSQGGVYLNARFDQDELAETLTGPGRHAGEVTIVWTPSLS